LSAKWRRSKKHTDRFNIFEAFNKTRNKNTSRKLKITNSWIKRQPRLPMFSLSDIREEDKCRKSEPLIDVLEENGEIRVVAEFAGFKRENIHIRLKSQRLTLTAEAAERKYYKSLNLPKRVNPNAIRTKYKNGVLEIRLKKSVEEKTVDKVAG